MVLESLPPRPLRSVECRALEEGGAFRLVRGAGVGSEGSVVAVVVVAEEWFAGLRFEADGWTVVCREECGVEEDPELLYMVALEALL